MISFFRKIRQKLLSQNRVTRYLVYALGEIFLVVIGILIALQVNNWNEGRKLNKQKAVLLENLEQDFEENQKRLDLIIGFLNDREKYARHILALLDSLPEKLDSIPTVFALERAGFVHYFNPTQPTYEEMKSSGTLSLISNKELKRVMSSYQTFLEYSYRIEEKNSDLIQSFADRILRYMDPDFGTVNITDNESKAYAGVHFDLKAMSNDTEIHYLLNLIVHKSIVEAGYKDRIFRPRLKYILELIKEEKKIASNE
ncbi:hypothetical protein SAMN00777080_1387 [Aquiflexum balticum DSM 16537]|uniref:Uncharacterized protein n=1 Tax=Aquiflexum balticum DSM 16537 TaxID=758820 RepID=A0A1W2H2H1_9BACT|nr:DUF6090 family protein [Aquiflexum balticum]SMD42822.1 hypothetical protein SAMN00777080_1387 [Aquiflexum balticum DSM 16537]